MVQNGFSTISSRNGRARHSKVRSGCITCKVRRIRCDEGKPACLRCTNTGRNCDGYEDLTLRGWIIVTGPSPALSTSAHAVQDDESCSGFEYFRLISALEFGRLSDANFWMQHVLQMGQTSTPVFHALAAVARQHQYFKLKGLLPLAAGADGPGSETMPLVVPSELATYESQAMSCYNKAISSLLAAIERHDNMGTRDEALTCSLLFIAFEVLRENEGMALVHLNSSISLLKAHDGSQLSSSCKQDGTLVSVYWPMVHRLDIQATVYSGSRVPGLNDIESLHHSTALMHYDVDFDSLEEIAAVLEDLSRRLLLFQRRTADHYRFRSVENASLDAICEQRALLVEFDHWKEKMENFVMRIKAKGAIHGKEQLQTLLLRVRGALFKISTEGCLLPDEIIFDMCHQEFAEIVRCSTLLLPDVIAKSTSSPGPTFTLIESIAYPLCWTVYKCRDAVLRREALNLLRLCPKEGVWDGKIQAHVLQRVIEIEENGNPLEFVPEYRRIHSLEHSFDRPNRSIRICYELRPHGLHGRWIESVEYVKY